jgi:putative FmdB family regulatory protein
LPLYEYRCTKCGFRFEKIQHFNAEPETECPKCHGVLKRPLTAPALQFKGAGWYVNDYAAKGGSAAEDKTSEPGAAAPAENKGGTAEPAAKTGAAPAASKPASAEPASKPASTTPSSSE